MILLILFCGKKFVSYLFRSLSVHMRSNSSFSSSSNLLTICQDIGKCYISVTFPYFTKTTNVASYYCTNLWARRTTSCRLLLLRGGGLGSPEEIKMEMKLTNSLKNNIVKKAYLVRSSSGILGSILIPAGDGIASACRPPPFFFPN